ncbi:hypothetical protein SH501x_001900 [Pirellulaceae bacterium SH501]
MKTKLVIAALLCFLPAMAYASLYSWVDTNRPPVTLSAALGKGELLLANDAKRYYPVDVRLYGNAEGDGKTGAWNIIYGCSDGSKKQVYVDMQGEAKIEDWSGPVDKMATEGRVTDLTELKQRLEKFMFSHNMPLDTVELRKESLSIRSRTREFKLHPELDNGEYGQETVTVIGPKADGVVIDVVLHSKQPPAKPDRWNGPYWGIIEQNYILAKGNGYLELSLLHGSGLPYEVVNRMERCFGERTQ